MSMEKKRMLLFGPGFGHNVEAKLCSLNDTSLFEVVFIAEKLDESFREKYPYINFVPSKFEVRKDRPLNTIKSIIWLYKQVCFTGHYDIIYSLGCQGLFGALPFLFASKKTKKALEIWSIKIIENAKNNRSFLQRVDRYIIDKVDLVCQYWWGIRELFINAFPVYEKKFLMYHLTYPDIFFSDEKHEPQSDFVKDFLKRVPDNQIICFWPRSFVPSNNHKLLIESLGLLKQSKPEILKNFKLYLWGGNIRNEETYSNILNAIEQNSLSENVEIVDHPFVPQSDIFAIEERSNFFVQITNDDILSTFIMEIICSCKPFVLSDNRTFQFLNEKYNLNIPLIENSSKAIADKICRILNNEEVVDHEVLQKRKELCRKYFSQSMNKPSALILYENI